MCTLCRHCQNTGWVSIFFLLGGKELFRSTLRFSKQNGNFQENLVTIVTVPKYNYILHNILTLFLPIDWMLNILFCILLTKPTEIDFHIKVWFKKVVKLPINLRYIGQIENIFWPTFNFYKLYNSLHVFCLFFRYC